jgi:NhaA family Na+:H+ antiporter
MPHPPDHQPPASALRAFLTSETASGVLLMGVGVLALVVANSPVAQTYFDLRNTHIGGLSMLHWINDGLMVVFFLLVGLEIKRELLDGQLVSWHRRVLPGISATAGMAVPALVYIALNWTSPTTLPGWAIPTATDIAFALGALALVRSRVPVSLKIFLTTLAILDDLGAVLIIGMFYAGNLSFGWLAFAGVVLVGLVGLNRIGVKGLVPYLTIGVLLWLVVLKSGVHATLAGVALAFTIPLQPSPSRPDDTTSPLHKLEHILQPWVAFAVVPIFGFANAGVSFVGIEWARLLEPVTLGIAAGLFVGKQIGVFLSAWAAVKLKLAVRPENASWAQIYGVSLMCGIGFTMSLFVGLLAFPDSVLQDSVKIGVLAGSLISAAAGILVLRFAPREQR